ncbi:hypothetical protein M5689_015464 [Euphorbia peplus]|nr:hypothetical protein M5689_015464 [Euphorbia peplus]
MSSSSMGLGFMAAFAVSGSVVLIARQFHKRLVSDFMKRIEFELKGPRRSCIQNQKRVRFSDESRIAKENRNKNEEREILKIENFINQKKISYGGKLLEAMPENRRVLYTGILKYRTLQGCQLSTT